ncbi:acyltransferase family protein [Brachybacterium sp. UNK5269]|uniref:acyltransferase family protein n=1 Tax=Brachybacterium sp. UNK5269 TaxID=3408576 RepID=UPI003BAFEB40
MFLAGTSGSRLGADRLLSPRPLSVLGDVSYGLYLIHWPFLTITLRGQRAQSAGLLLGARIIAVSMVLAWLLTRLVDTPIRRWSWANARCPPVRAGGAGAAAGVGPRPGRKLVLERAAEDAERRAVADNPGARVLDPGFTPHPDANPEAAPAAHRRHPAP